MAKAAAYKDAFSVSTKEELADLVPKVRAMQGPILVEIKIRNGARKDLGRPKNSTEDNKKQFM